MKRLIFLLLFLSLLVSSAVAEETGVVIDRTANLTEEYLFPEGTPLLEIVFPPCVLLGLRHPSLWRGNHDFAGDVENRAQASYSENEPEGGIKADILKYPHHGQIKLRTPFLNAIDPEFVFMNGAFEVMESAKKYLKQKKIPLRHRL